MREKKSMTVKELIKALKKMDQNKTVITEGCDCYGDVGSVEEDGDSVCLYRSR